eukprot:1194655-Prorocentrum_minimum.AAC.2
MQLSPLFYAECFDDTDGKPLLSHATAGEFDSPPNCSRTISTQCRETRRETVTQHNRLGLVTGLLINKSVTRLQVLVNRSVTRLQVTML